MNPRKPVLLFAVMAMSVLRSASGAAVTPVLAPGSYASGGISAEGQQEMQVTRDLYNLRLTFAQARTGAFVAGVSVKVESVDRNGASFGPFLDCGPLLYIALRPGVYRITADYAGLTRSTIVRVGAGAAHATLYWPAESEP
ncbi:hypothetical protein WKW80_31745 [Variovorax humicola]|uniref:Carboxypeptidase regulatory-like domain-containing protein n=1 Tax=Variovorax humicola TaxID=1769758 RepID=A0ABU8W995_9BURK